MIQNVIVLGGGTAGLMAALALKRKIPQLNVRIVRSPDIGVIGVGESTTPQFPVFLFDYLGISRKRFYAAAQPTYKIGIHFNWGPRRSFEYGFDRQLDAQWSDLPRPNGFYCDQQFENISINSALMAQAKAFTAQPNGGGPNIEGFAAFHLFNPLLVKTLDAIAVERGITFIDAKVTGVALGEQGVKSIALDDGRQLEADFFVDASGFRSELLGRALQTPFVPYDRSLYCDRAIVGTWDRADDFLYPYTIADTMPAGWCWTIDHEHAVNCGYVYSSKFISDDQARDQFQQHKPRAKIAEHVLKYRTGRYAKGWVKNVFGIGNACGFVEPLESTALMVASSQIQSMVDILLQSELELRPKMLELYNNTFAEWWDEIRDFLAIHYKFNTRLKNDFWTAVVNDTDVSGVQPLLDFYAENGPTGMCRHLLQSTLGLGNQFGIEGFLVMLVGQQVPYHVKHKPSDAERAIFQRHCNDFKLKAQQGMTVAETLKYVKHPGWTWFGDK